MDDKTKTPLFLLYVSVMLVITFLQQEFVLMPQLQSIDLVGEEARVKLLDTWQKWRWISFLFSPLLLVLRLSLVSMCLFLGGFFFVEMSGHKYKEWWGVVLGGQAVLLVFSVAICIVNISYGADKALEITRYTSLLFLGGKDCEQWITVALSAISLFEIIYWVVLSLFASKLCATNFWRSFRFVMSSYGVGYFFYIVLLMFLTLYLT